MFRNLIIHPLDVTTDFLCEIYSDIDCTVNRNKFGYDYLRNQIMEHDRIIMLGHGSSNGLFGKSGYVIGKNFVDLLINKSCVCIWCNADNFVKQYEIKGFYTGMFISELYEAKYHNVKTNIDLITKSNETFAKAVKESIDTDDMLNNVIKLYPSVCDVSEYNRNRLYYK